MHKANAAFCGENPRENRPPDCFCTPPALLTELGTFGRCPDRSHIGALAAAGLRLSQRAAWMPAVVPPRPCKLLEKLNQNFSFVQHFLKCSFFDKLKALRQTCRRALWLCCWKSGQGIRNSRLKAKWMNRRRHPALSWVLPVEKAACPASNLPESFRRRNR